MKCFQGKRETPGPVHNPKRSCLTYLAVVGIMVLVSAPLFENRGLDRTGLLYCVFLMLINLATVWIGCVSFRSLFQSLCPDEQQKRKASDDITLKQVTSGATPRGIFCENEMPGLLAALLYTCSPYRIYVMYGKGDLNELLALVFLPMVFGGMLRVLTVDPEKREYKRAWLWPTVGLCAMLFFDMTDWELSLFLLLLLCAANGKNAFSAKRLLSYGKILLVNAAGLAFRLISLQNVISWDSYISGAAAEQIQSKGTYLLDYFILFARAGTYENRSVAGMQYAVPAGAGFALMVLLLLYFWILFTGRYREERKRNILWRLTLPVTLTGLILLWMSTVSFPWDLLRQNRLILILTAGLTSPMELVPFVCVCLIFTGIVVLWQMMHSESRQAYGWILTGIVVLAVTATQFLNNDYQETGIYIPYDNVSDLAADEMLDVMSGRDVET